jgi:hypothetical protein
MKALTLVFCCLALAVSLHAASGGADAVFHGRGGPGSLDTQWGPDLYGYRAKDPAAPGGPTAQWIDISAFGTEVTGLADDNIMGPFPIGWPFHYYWYDVANFWVGSNGYIKFSTPGMLAQGNIYAFPDQRTPNDVVAPYVADWIFSPTDSSRCYRWSNGTDTLIVMWKNVAAWMQSGNIGNHNFELILAGGDSSITFQYGVQQDSVSNNNIAVGMEDLTGRAGISCFFGTYPPSNYAIKFEYPDTVTYLAHDAATAAVLNTNSGGIFIRTGDSLTPWMSVRDAGNQPEADIHVKISVRNSGNSLLAQDSSVVARTINPMDVVDIPFAPLWRAGNPGVYKATGRVFMGDDVYAGNDSIRTEIHTMNLPGEMAYDDGSSNRSWGWAGGFGGMGMQFVPPVYPVEVTQLRFFIVTGIADGFDATIYDDDGLLGAPGTLIEVIHVNNPTSNAWASVTIPAGTVIINDGSFYVAWMQSVDGITFGLDTTSAPGISRRSWEFAGGWAENRMNQEADCMIRCTIRSYVAPNHPPGAFARIAPADSAEDPWQEMGRVLFSWHASPDLDGDPISYHFQLTSPTYAWADTNVYLTDTTLLVEIPILTMTDLDEIHNFYWRVWARDGHDSTEASNGRGIIFLDLPESAENPNPVLIREFALAVYPNPFNPVATLHYAVPQAGMVELKIFNIVGEQVAVLKNGFTEPGRYRLQWNAADLPTGTYFAVLKSGATTKIQKLLLLK